MQLLDTATGACLTASPVSATTTNAALAAAEAIFRGSARHAEARRLYKRTVQAIADDESRKREDRIFGDAFRAAYAARLLRTSLSRDEVSAANAAKKPLSRGIV